MRTARVRRETGLIRLLTTRVSGGTPSRVFCLGQDQKTLAPDIFGCVDVGGECVEFGCESLPASAGFFRAPCLCDCA